MSDIQRLARNLRYAIDISGETQKWLAEQSGVTETYLSRILTGKVDNVTLEMAASLAEPFGLRVRDLLDEPGRFILSMKDRLQVA